MYFSHSPVFSSLVACVLFLNAATAHAQSDSARQDFGPRRTPDRILLTWTDAPTTTQTVTWRTDTTAGEPVAEIALATDGPQFVRDLKRYSATSQKFSSPLGESVYHSATFRDLQPGTKYVYRVGDGNHWSEFSHFTTVAEDAEPFSFVYFGDSQNNVKSHWSRVVREALQHAPQARFFLHAGDLVNRPNSDLEWGEWFYAAGWINRTIPVLATPGNHEYESGRLSELWRPTFQFPDNGPEGYEDTVYYLDIQGARFISLNSNADYRPQREWLEKVLAENTQRWTIVTFHHPVYSTARGRDNSKLRDTFQPVFDRFRVDLVLQGHDHTYGRTGLVQHAHSLEPAHAHNESPGPLRNLTLGRQHQDPGGTVYVVSVSGPKMYRLGENDVFEKTAANKQLFQIVTISEDRLRYSARTATGVVYDQFELRKRENQPNLLIETR